MDSGLEPSKASFSGFSTAKGSAVTVSAESLKKAAKLFEESTAEPVNHEETPGLPTLPNSGFQCGFMSGKGTKISVSKEALAKSAKLFDECNNGDDKEEVTPSSTFPKSGFQCGFMSGKGATISVSKEAIAKSAKLFADDSVVPEPCASVESSQEVVCVPTASTDFSSPFANAKGTPISVSKKAMLHAAKIFEEEKNGSDDAETRGHFDPPKPKLSKYEAAAPNAHSPSFCKPVSNTCELSESGSTPSRNGLSSQIMSKARKLYPANRKSMSPVLRSPRQNALALEMKKTNSLSSAQSYESPMNFAQQKIFKRSYKSPSTVSVPLPKFPPPSEATTKSRTFGLLMEIRKDHKNVKSFKDVVSGHPQVYTDQQLSEFGVFSAVRAATADTAADFVFSLGHLKCQGLVDNDLCLLNGWSVDINESCTSFKEIESAFIGHESVDAALVPDGWVQNHFKWIVYKLAAYEVTYPQIFANKQLTVQRVLDQLRYRYDREIEKAERPCLRKICEGDDIACKPMVLMVVQRGSQEGSNELHVSDGWYSIRARVSHALLKFDEENGGLGVGCKLFLYGATLVGFESGHHPLQAPDTVYLSLDVNCVRRAKWHAKLGYASLKQCPTFCLKSLHPQAGNVAAVSLYIARVYPLQFVERDLNGRPIYRTEKQEEVYAGRFEKHRQKIVENIREMVMAENSGPTQQTQRGDGESSQDDDTDDETGEGLYKLMNNAPDTGRFSNSLSSDQRRLLWQYCENRKAEKQDKMRETINKAVEDNKDGIPTRKVNSLIKVRVCGLTSSDVKCRQDAILNIYNPPQDFEMFMKEGSAVLATNISVLKPRYQENTIVLASNKSTRFLPAKQKLPLEIVQNRTLTVLSMLKNELFTAPWNEIDIVVGVLSIRSRNDCDIVYVCDCEGQIAAIKFKETIQGLMLSELIRGDSVLAFKNISCASAVQSTTSKLLYLDYTMLTTVSSAPKDTHLAYGVKLMNEKTKQFLADCRTELKQMLGLCTTPSYNDAPYANGQARATVSPAATKIQQLQKYESPANVYKPPTMLISNTPKTTKQFKPPTRHVQ